MLIRLLQVRGATSGSESRVFTAVRSPGCVSYVCRSFDCSQTSRTPVQALRNVRDLS